MQFSDRIQIENNLLLTVKQYRSKSCFIGPYQIVCIGQPSEGERASPDENEILLVKEKIIQLKRISLNSDEFKFNAAAEIQTTV